MFRNQLAKKMTFRKSTIESVVEEPVRLFMNKSKSQPEVHPDTANLK